MSPTLGSSENSLKSRSVPLVPKACLALSFARLGSSVASTPSSLSVTSEPVTCDHYDSPRCDNCAQLGRDSFSSAATSNGTSDNRDCACQQPVNCVDLFHEFVKENTLHSLSPNCLSKLDLVGFVYPSTLLVVGPHEALKLLSSLWSRRLLKTPVGYCLRYIGHTSVLEVSTISQAHFTPLAEALHRCIEELNSLQLTASFEAVVRQLHTEFPDMELPSEDILRTSLNSLVAESKLSYDEPRQVYTATRTLLTPWDEFESLTLSDNYKPEREGEEEEEIELEFKNVHSESMNRSANLDQLLYMKSKTLSTGDSASLDCRENHFAGSGPLLRRNSSFSNEIDQFDPEHRRAHFKRSKSFKISYKASSDENSQLISKDCTCSDIIIKRQSLLSKLWKFGHSNNHPKTRSVSSSSSTSSVKCSHFGSQFPEDSSDKCAVIPYRAGYVNRQVELQSKSTQTVKCGPEDIVTLVMRQAGRHALAKNRPSHARRARHSSAMASDELEQSPLLIAQTESACARSQRCATCDTAPVPYLLRYKGGSKKTRYRQYSPGELAESVRCQCGPTDFAPSHHHPLRHREGNRHRKLRSSSMRHYRPNNEWLVVEGARNKHQLRRGTRFMLTNVHSDDEHEPSEEHFNCEHKHLDSLGVGGPAVAHEPRHVNGSPNMNGHWRNGQHGPHSGQTNNSAFFALSPCGGVIINNSVNLKIEIETSKVACAGGTMASDSLPVRVSTDHPSPVLGPMPDVCAAPLSSRAESKASQFANDIYSELTFDRHTHKLSHVTTSGVARKSNAFSSNTSYNPDLNYTNSITALKEQIARAKANFFNAPLSSSTR